MFINCPFCKALVATDPATDQPPERCPRCAAPLRDLPTDAAPAATATAVPVFDLLEVPTPEVLADVMPPALAPPPASIERPADTAGSTPTAAIAPIATLLRTHASGPRPESVATDSRGNDAPPPDATPPAPAPPKDAEPPPDAPAAAPDPTAATPPTPADLDAVTEQAPADAESAVLPDAVAADAHPLAAETTAAPATEALEPPAPAVAAEPTATAAAGASAGRALPSFARRARTGASGFNRTSGLALAALALLLVFQLLLADRAHLAADARWRPLLSNVCGLLGCSLPAWREPAAFTVLARDVRPHPARPGVLRVTATFRNDARWPQPWPHVRLTLSDIDGRAVAARDFAAGDYLAAAPSQAELRSGQSASIAMDVVEPATRSVAFDFALH